MSYSHIEVYYHTYAKECAVDSIIAYINTNYISYKNVPT